MSESMSEFVKSLRRLYSFKTIGDDVIAKLYEDKKITTKERDYILNNPTNVG